MSCIVCGSSKLLTVLELERIPIFCNVQYSTREAALSQPRGDMQLVYCLDCRHVFNAAFDASLLEYGEHYENSLHFSGTFGSYARELAVRLIDKYQLRKGTIVEIGCGKGDFLALMCELGENHGLGFDQSFESGRGITPKCGDATYFAEFFSERHLKTAPDLLVCRHVMEHVWSLEEFLRPISAVLSIEEASPVYIEVPNALYTIRDFGIWDLIYEHCHYFTEHSLTETFARGGFGRIQTYEAFGGQFLGLEAVRGGTGSQIDAPLPAESEAGLARGFAHRFENALTDWRELVQRSNDERSSVVVWGAGSKGVSFLNFLQLDREIEFVVDINPYKQGSYTPGTGHEIVAPEALQGLSGATVFVMNPMYHAEIAQTLSSLGVSATLQLVN